MNYFNAQKMLAGSADRLAFILDQHACVHMDKLMERVTIMHTVRHGGLLGRKTTLHKFFEYADDEKWI